MTGRYGNNFLRSLFVIIAITAASCRAFADSPYPVHTLIVEPDDRKQMLIDAIDGAKSYVDLTIYEMNDPDIIGALETAAKKGVKVKVLYNYSSFQEKQRIEVAAVMASLESRGVLTKPATSEFTVTHQKTFVIDGEKAVIMTFNLQPRYFSGTRDFGIITVDTPEVTEIKNVFDADWDYRSITPTAATLVWSPDNSRQKILAAIKGAAVSLDVYNEELEDKGCLDALKAKAKSGVNVRLISARLYANGRDVNYPGRKALNNGGVAANYGTELYIHAKMVLADAGQTAEAAYVGSENFSSTSLDHNRELGIIVTEKDILDRLENEFEVDWAQSRNDATY
jgi:cardiolipin synthase A/B